jgi:hypothetical protein
MAQAESLKHQARLGDLTFVGDGDAQKRARSARRPTMTEMASWRLRQEAMPRGVPGRWMRTGQAEDV